MLRRAAPALSMLLVLACGGGKPPATAPVEVAPPATGSATGSAAGSASLPPGVASLSSTSGEGLEAAGTAAAYLHALSQRDWPGACATWRRADRAKLAKGAGSCERGVAARLERQPIAGLATATTGALRKRGDTIAVDVVQPDQTEVITTLLLQREDGLWLLIDRPAGESF